MADSLTATDLNLALCHALGITDLSGIARVDLTLRPGQPPCVTVVRHVRPDATTPARVHQVVQQFELQLAPRPVVARANG